MRIYSEKIIFSFEIEAQGLEEEKRINPLLKKLSKETGIGLVATNDVHYINKEDSEFHDILLCIQTGSFVADTDRMRFANSEFYRQVRKRDAQRYLLISLMR